MPEGVPVAAPSEVMLDAGKQFGSSLFEVPAGQPLETLQQRLMEVAARRNGDSAGAHVLIDAVALARALEIQTGELRTQEQARAQAACDLLQAFFQHLEPFHANPAEAETLTRIRSSLDTLSTAGIESIREPVIQALATLSQGQAVHQAGYASLAPPAVVVSDPCTGLPLKVEAEAALQRLAGSAQSYLAVFYVHRMSLINARFGEEVGNEIILFCSQHLATSVIRTSDLLFRCSGPAFVAILEREESPQAVAGEVRRIVSTPLSRFFDNSSRTMYLPIRMTAETFPLANQAHGPLMEQIARFIMTASQAG